MTSSDVIDLYATLVGMEVEIRSDGGWGVDALLERQTRPHQDLDIAIQEKDLPCLRKLLRERGFKGVKTEQARDWNFVLGDARGREIDVHVIVLDASGNGVYGPAKNGELYPAAALRGTGTIAGRTVRCISPEWMVKFHSGYDLKEKDFRDVSALCAKFGLDLPSEYNRFKK